MELNGDGGITGNGAGKGKFLYSVVFLQIKAVHLVGQAASSSKTVE